MKSLLGIVTVIALGALTACSATAGAKGGSRSLVSPSQPHAIISTAQPPGPNYYTARIVWLDGSYLSTTRNRDTFWVAPGVHKIGFSAIITGNRGGSVISSPATSSPEDMPTLTLDLKQGYTYYFAAEVPQGGMVNQWKPILIKTVKPSGD